ncbi:hypothetical protein GCM10007291_26140 [Gemmobacter nanjingensis]|uniref:Uncharacterized protein n=1 Tax=Gemmobacter nanjingensis TaxID=488454 RepID=A0ABQ3FID6_9RHOB|nr:hypothetical protein GCM10007291_26140 [Gemmobacter nanjingensis]
MHSLDFYIASRARAPPPRKVIQRVNFRQQMRSDRDQAELLHDIPVCFIVAYLGATDAAE